MTSGRLPIGAVASAHGVRGQFKVKPFTATPRDIAAYGPVWAGDRQLTLTVRGMTANGMVIVSAAEVTDRDAAQALRGTPLEVDRAALPEAGDDEVYHADLIGMKAETPDGTLLGRLVALHDFGAGEIAEVKPADGPSLMLPFDPAFVPQIDIAAGRIILDPPDGLLEPDADDGDAPEDGGDG
jgi:16S rRNA processing protein RimM